ncbi:MAG TPA: heterodisulfide reductase-related iron-sulfur binding cluster [Chloroflexota bacterium]|nr:heterodisulfide reductase-related iron-sulfur binding cluster [Chloroflexota bacterium]
MTVVGTEPAAADLSQCVHCGLCLQNCPTYLLTGYEAESPRGRIHLIQALTEGRVEPNDAYRTHIEQCLVCRNCESVCPSGVHFGRIMEAGRAQLYERASLPLGQRVFRRLAFRELLPHRARLRLMFGALRLYQRLGLQRLVRATGLLPKGHAEAESLLPPLPPPFEPRWEVFPAEGETRYRVGMFTGCVMPLVYGPVHAATLRVLRHNGCEVHVPRQQVCCGALNVHGGEQVAARELARQNVRAFLGRGLDAIVVNSAGCGATMKEYGQLLDDSGAAEFARLTRDVTEFLAGIELQPFTRTVRRTVTLQESCHLVHAQRIKDAPRALLGALPGVDLRDMAHPDLCCGSAGLYMLTEREMSTRILDEKMVDITSTGAGTIVTANPGCMMQLQRGVRRAGLHSDVKHVVELVDEAYGG